MFELALLLFLYTLQGIPMGLSGSVPLLLVADGRATYSDLSVFSLVSLPFSLKLLWAPLVDAYYVPRVGRRKTWLLPVMLMVSAVMILFGSSTFGSLVDGYMSSPDVFALSSVFVVLYLLMATQDIAVDGWALTILPSNKLHYASTCNSLGQNLGFFIGYGGLLALSDVKTCNRFFRYEPSELPVATLGSFMSFWGFIMLFSLIPISLFPESKDSHADDEQLSVKDSYFLLARMFQNKPCRDLLKLFLLIRVPFATTETATHLKIVEAGVPKESMLFMAPFVMMLAVVSPVMVTWLSRRIGGSMATLKLGFLLRCLMVFPLVATVAFTSRMVHHYGSHNLPAWVYGIILVVNLVQNFVSDIMFVSQLAFFAEISDASVGGTYMTFLNTVANMGAKWPSTASLWLLDRWPLDGMSSFVAQAATGLVLGAMTLPFYTNSMRRLGGYPRDDWRVGTPTSQRETELRFKSE